ncbi:pseudouridine synthase [Violaceomyces palustris]|uniref:Pseudouridine synthase n=1 Tax=Violaceomyces palustris TaxID=1673888 RepID=A0ACD0NQA6_9BASI|nr:pseudouridine synthase [Violaceomyces palustris]
MLPLESHLLLRRARLSSASVVSPSNLLSHLGGGHLSRSIPSSIQSFARRQYRNLNTLELLSPKARLKLVSTMSQPTPTSSGSDRPPSVVTDSLEDQVDQSVAETDTGPKTSRSTSTLKSTTNSPSIHSRPLSGVFGLNKPSGPTSMSLLDRLKPLLASSKLFQDPNSELGSEKSWREKKSRRRGGGGGRFQKHQGAPKIGQGGTLDPLADGVLVIGLGNGTKKLSQYLDCTKYRTTGLLGSCTTSYDSQDPIMKRTKHSHVDEELIRSKLEAFRGEIQQKPPLYSAVRIDGKRLFEYARQGLELPRPIESRKVSVHEIRLVRFLPAGQHPFQHPDSELEEEEVRLVGRVKQLVERSEGILEGEGGSEEEERGNDQDESNLPSSAFVLEMKVSSGTYVRSIVHDLASECQSSAHVVTLTRLRQGEWSIDQPGFRGNCIDWDVFEKAIEELEEERSGSRVAERDQDGLREWERVLLSRISPC